MKKFEKVFEELNIEKRLPVANHAAKTIVMSDTFARAAAEPGSNEFIYLMSLRQYCPDYEIITRKARASKKAGKERIPYDKMRNYILCLRNGEQHMNTFERVVLYSKSQKFPYNTVYNWFIRSFPDYGITPEFDKDGFPIVRANTVGVNDLIAELPLAADPQDTEDTNELKKAV